MKGINARSVVQIGISAGLIALLLWVAHKHHVWDQVAKEPRSAIGVAAALILVTWAINSVRWGLLLRVAGIHEKAGTLLCLYLIGTFCTLLLPTGTGGDAVRIYDVARRKGRAAVVIVATLQERLIGMGVGMAIGLWGVAMHWGELPPGWRTLLAAIPALAIAAVAVLIYPKIPAAIAGSIWRRWPAARRWEEKGIVKKIVAAMRPAAEMPPLTPARLAPVLAVTVVSALLSFAIYWILGRGADVNVPYSGYCLVVPLVWVIAMTPSVGGAGVREGGFVLLMGELFGMSKEKSLAVAAIYLIVQTAVACIGGVLLVMRAPSWRKVVEEVTPSPDPPAASAAQE